MAKISVVVPVYNVESYLEDCLNSIMKQTLPVHEIIAVNDGSTDRSGQILDEWSKKYNHIHVIHQPNSGAPGGPRNKGIELAKGDFISFIDPDDLIEDDYYETALKNIGETIPDIIVTNIYKFNSKKKWLPPTFKKVGLFNENKLTNLFEFPHLIHNLGPANKLFKRSFLINHQLRFLEGYAYEDVHFTCCCYYLAKEIVINKDAVYYWRRRESEENPSITQQKHLFQSVLDRITVHQEIDQFLESHDFTDYKYIKDVRAILDFIRHGNSLYKFDDKEREAFFDKVNQYLETIDAKAYDYLPAHAKRYYLTRLFFLRNRLDYELVASAVSDYGFLPAETKNKDGKPKILFDLSYLKSDYGDDDLYYKEAGVPSNLLTAKAILKKGSIDEHKLSLSGYGYIDYMNVFLKEQIDIEVLIRKRGSDKDLAFPAALRPSPEINGVIKHNYCGFTVEIPLDQIDSLISNGGILDIRLSITIDGLNKMKRLGLSKNQAAQKPLLENHSPHLELYITKNENISIKEKS
ncbi:glycosyltransferase involved in cell wall biosynthesis [Scopulibacillus daqui]|uniref:Glycosyltransferase involved in cell wall biosynthesis n=1 Tax=Scopulibacillus daqui TaxID=1469162 RepID=A0ABS2PYD4_9BACL|nr:glycosyltransferase involved in cell wall biosynthesis [Scopulibacillus daqui]